MKDNCYDGNNCILTDVENKINYKGSFQKGKMTGRGRLIYPNGDIYDGYLEDGLKHGNGKYTLIADKSYFDGRYEKDIKNGEGVFFNNQTKKSYTGNFKNGQLHGQIQV